VFVIARRQQTPRQSTAYWYGLLPATLLLAVRNDGINGVLRPASLMLAAKDAPLQKYDIKKIKNCKQRSRFLQFRLEVSRQTRVIKSRFRSLFAKLNSQNPNAKHTAVLIGFFSCHFVS
jgi:hypothetical protein